LRKNLSSNKNHTFEEDVKRQDSNVLLIGAGAKPCRSKVLVAGSFKFAELDNRRKNEQSGRKKRAARAAAQTRVKRENYSITSVSSIYTPDVKYIRK
jgi:hypothetical protein